MLGFITGRNSAARKKAMYEMMEKNPKPTYLIVPEQFTFESEKALASYSADYDSRYLEAVSFTRLANLIFRTYGGIAGTYSDDSTKLMLMGAALSECAGDLSYYQKSAGSVSFIRKLLETDAELKNAGMEPSDITKIAETAGSDSLRSKANDLSAVFTRFESLLSESWLDPLSDLRRACEILDTENFFAGRCIFIESFAGFTGIEYRMLEHIIRQADSVIVNIATDGYLYDHTEGTGLFSETQKTAERLMAIARKNGIKVLDPIVAEVENDPRPAAITALENRFLQRGSSSCENDGAVTLVLARSPWDEADFVACKIRELAEEGMRWKDIKVTCRDLGIYEHAIKVSFEKAGIPLFLDRDESVSSHPLAAFVSASLSAARRGLDSKDIMRALKTGILPITEEDASDFENYCFVWGIHGGQFRSDFTKDPRGFSETHSEEEMAEELSRINGVRRLICDPLARLSDSLESADGRKFAKALWEYLCDCGVTDGLRRLYDSATAEGNIAFAESLDSYWNFTVSAIDKFSVSLGSVSLGRETMTKLFDLVMGSAKIGQLPQTLDSVAVGSAERMRMAGPRAVFVMGLCDGIFPAKPASGSIFTESEREEMKELGFELAHSQDEFITAERMHAYSVFTAPSEKLFLSRFRYDHHFEEQSDSVFIGAVRDAVGDLPEITTSDLPESFWLCSERFAFDRLSKTIGDPSPETEAVKKALSESESFAGKVGILGTRLRTDSIGISDPGAAKRLFGDELFISPTAIEKYESCPFKYFISNGLNLKELQKAEISPLSRGNIVHYVLQHMIENHGGHGLADLSADDIKKEIKELSDRYLEIALGSAEGKTAKFRYQYRAIRESLFKILMHVREEFKNSLFEPRAFELGLGEGEVPCYELTGPKGEKVSIHGKIDRLDTVTANDGDLYVRIVDYKTGEKKFKFQDVYYGLDLQMLIYLFAAWDRSTGSLEGAKPAGILYMPAGDVPITADRRDLLSKSAEDEKDKRCMNGLILDDPEIINAMDPGGDGVFIPDTGKKNGSESLATLAELGKIRSYVDSLIGEMADSVYSGRIAASPLAVSGSRTSCDICSYRSICRRRESDPVREQMKLDKDGFMSLIDGEGKGDGTYA